MLQRKTTYFAVNTSELTSLLFTYAYYDIALPSLQKDTCTFSSKYPHFFQDLRKGNQKPNSFRMRTLLNNCLRQIYLLPKEPSHLTHILVASFFLSFSLRKRKRSFASHRIQLLPKHHLINRNQCRGKVSHHILRQVFRYFTHKQMRQTWVW